MRPLLPLLLLALLVAPAGAAAQGVGSPLTDEPPVEFAEPEPEPAPEESEPEPAPEDSETEPAPDEDAPSLPDTGAPAAVLALLGAGLLASGASLRLHARLLGD